MKFLLFTFLISITFVVFPSQITKVRSLGKTSHILYDTNEVYTYNTVQQAPFILNTTKIFNFGLDKNSHWIKLDGNTIPHDHRFIELSNAPTENIFFYLKHKQSSETKKVSINIFKRFHTEDYFFTSNVYFSIPENHEDYIYYIHFPLGKLSNYTNIFSGSAEQFAKKDISHSIFIGSYTGFIVIIIIFSILSAFFFKEKSYFLYALYTGALSTLMLTFEGYAPYIFGTTIYEAFVTNPFRLTSCSSIALVLFVLNFFNIKKMSKWMYYVGIGIAFSLIPFTLIYHNISKETDAIYQILLLLGGMYSSSLIMRAAIKGNRTASLFWVGYISLIISSALFILRNFDALFFAIPENTIIIGHMIETSFFTIGIIISVLKLKKEKTIIRQNLINIEKEAKRVLEEKVQSRTKELQTTNKHLRSTLVLVSDQKNKLEQRNEHIKSSIAYASQIQYSILPAPHKLREIFKDSFILNKPKDKVSGDFFYFEDIYKNNESHKIVVVADCTGHGVTGAFMTLLGFNILKNTISIKEETNPKKILIELNKDFEEYSNNNPTLDLKDGMDVSVINYNTTQNTIEFSGAKTSILHLSNTGTNIIKGSRSRIGGIGKTKKEYNSFKFNPEKGDSIYLYSDGYCDQLGGETRKKLMFKNFVGLLKFNKKHPMHDQKEKLEKELFIWQGELPQTDDILVIGLRL